MAERADLSECWEFRRRRRQRTEVTSTVETSCGGGGGVVVVSSSSTPSGFLLLPPAAFEILPSESYLQEATTSTTALLTPQQLRQALDWLVRNDCSFVSRLIKAHYEVVAHNQIQADIDDSSSHH